MLRGFDIISNLTGEAARAEEIATPQYWRRHMRGTVLFHAGLQSALATGCDTFLEIGPQPHLKALAVRADESLENSHSDFAPASTFGLGPDARNARLASMLRGRRSTGRASTRATRGFALRCRLIRSSASGIGWRAAMPIYRSKSGSAPRPPRWPNRNWLPLA